MRRIVFGARASWYSRGLILLLDFLVLSAFGVFASGGNAIAQSQSKQAKAPPALQSPVAKRGLEFSVGTRGLDSLSFNGQSLLRSPQSGELQPSKSVLRTAVEALLPHPPSPVAMPNKQTDTTDLIYPWGRVSCTYGKQGDKITMRIEVSNASAEPLNEVS